MNASQHERPFHPPSDAGWHARRTEPALEPDLEIVDAHHHLFDRPGWQYRLDDLLADLRGGHRVSATVYLQCGQHYRDTGPAALQPVGETEYVDAAATQSLSLSAGRIHACAAIVGFADLTLGAPLDEVLQAHLQASPGRFRGIRHGVSADADPAFTRASIRPAPGLLADADFRAGFSRLAIHGLSFDAWLYHPQIPELLDLARTFPDTTIILNHVGGPLGIGHYAGQRAQVFEQWRSSIQALAACPNVVVKLGGLGMRLCGFGFDEQPEPPGSVELASAWKPYIDTCIEAFGPQRAMFESNFPVDGCSCGYGVLWNAFKRIAEDCTADEKAALFAGTARRVYRI